MYHMQIIMFVMQEKIIGDSTDSFRKRVTIFFMLILLCLLFSALV
jgi:hypothetical protein